MPDEKFIDLESAANTLGITVVRLWQYIHTGKIKATKVNDEQFISQIEIDRFIAENNVSDPPNESQGVVSQQSFIPREHGRHVGRAQIFPGVSSTIMEAIVEVSTDMEKLDDLKQIIDEHARECINLIQNIEHEGITDPRAAVELLLIDEAIRNLNIRRSLFLRLLSGQAVILLPLPPHLCDTLLGVSPTGKVFITDRNLPPHLKNAHYPNLDFVPLAETEKMMNGVSAAVLEGYIEHQRIYVRDTSSNFLYILQERGLTDIFIHSIPHIPPKARFVELIVSNYINVTTI